MTCLCFYSVLPCLLLAEQSNLLRKIFSHLPVAFTNLGMGWGWRAVRKGKHGVLITEWNELIRSLYFAFSKEMLVF